MNQSSVQDYREVVIPDDARHAHPESIV